ncbi:MAG: DUF6288 domain-containing protein [Kiritimatiellia bacterium]
MRLCTRGKFTNHALALALLAALLAGRLPAETPAPPDLTADRGVDRKLTYNLGATGMRGWIYTKPATFLDSVQGRTTAASRQILVTHVGKDTPADGVMKVDDVILGADGSLFSDDARKGIARAIQAAENTGELKLTRWRAGKTGEVRLKMRVLGAYSGTAPFDCPKSKVVFEEACRALAAEPLKDDLWGAVNGLALLAAGKPEYLPKVRELAHKIGPPGLDLKNRRGLVVWEWGYMNLFLGEYYLITRDPDVLDAIRAYTLTLARGQSRYGTLATQAGGAGRGRKAPRFNPARPSRTAAGVNGNLAIILGGKCGVQDPRSSRHRARQPVLRLFRGQGRHSVRRARTAALSREQRQEFHGRGDVRIQGRPGEGRALLCDDGDGGLCQPRVRPHRPGSGLSLGALGANAAAQPRRRRSSGRRPGTDLVRRCDGSFTYDGANSTGPAGRTTTPTRDGAATTG